MFVCVCVRFVHMCYLCACLLGFQNLLNVTERILKTMSKTTTITGSTISRNTRSNNSNKNVCVQMIRNAILVHVRLDYFWDKGKNAQKQLITHKNC